MRCTGEHRGWDPPRASATRLAGEGQRAKETRIGVGATRVWPVLQTALANAGLVDRLSFLDCFANLEIRQSFGINRGRVLGQDDEIGKLAHLDRALVVFLKMLPGRPEGHRLERRNDVDALCRAKDVSRPGPPRDGRSEDAHAVGKRHRRIVMRAEHHAPRADPSGRGNIFGTHWADCVIPVPIAPVFDDQTDMTIAVNLGGKSVKGPIRDGKKVISAADVAYLVFDAMQSTIARQKLAAYPPDLVIEIPRDAARTFDVDRAVEMIELGRRRATETLQQNGILMSKGLENTL